MQPRLIVIIGKQFYKYMAVERQVLHFKERDVPDYCCA